MIIIEDKPLQRQDLYDLFSAPPREWESSYRMSKAHVHVASTGNEGLSLLREAAEKGVPYDLMILDLGLPLNQGEDEDPEVGLKILRQLDPRACIAVLIVSQHQEVDTFAALLKAGAAHFIPKPYQREEVFREAANAYYAALRRRWDKTKAAHQQRYAELERALVADRMALAASDQTALVLDAVDQLSRQLSHRYQLDPELDRDDPVCKSVDYIRKSAMDVMRECTHAREAFRPISGGMEAVALDSLVERALGAIHDGILLHDIRVHFAPAPNHTVHTFRQCLDFILGELLIRSVESRDGASTSLEIGENKTSKTWEIRVKGGLLLLDQATRAKIQSGEPFDLARPDYRGLSLAQRVAKNIGAELLLQEVQGGTTFIIQIPVTAHDETTGHR